MNISSVQGFSKTFLFATVAGFALLSAAPSFAQTAPQAAADEADSKDEIIVTGTRRTDRSAADSASPVDVITAAEINTQPAADLLDVVKNIVPAFQF